MSNTYHHTSRKCASNSDYASRSGSEIGRRLRFVRELEQGKETLRLDKVNQVLLLFGQEIGPVPIKKE